MRRILKTITTILFGIIFTLLLFEIGLFAFGKLERIVQKVKNNFSKTDEFVILALGESTTAPVYDFNMKDYSWPAYLEKLLNKLDLNKNIKVVNEGINSITSDRILSDLEKNIEKYDPDLVISMMGINDYFGEIVYERAANIEADSLPSKSRTYKLIKFLIANVKDKIQLNNKEELDCDSEESCIHLASLRKNGPTETKLAIKFLEKTLDYNPNNVDVMISLGEKQMYSYNYNNNEDVIKAMKWFEKALEHDPKNPVAYNFLIQSLMNNTSPEKEWLEKIEKDMDRIQKNIEEYEIKDVNLFLTLATYETCPQDFCYETKQSGNEKRIYYLNKALETDPQNPDVFFELARYYAQYGDFNEAENFYLQVLQADVENEIYTTTLIELANLYLKTERQALAEETFKKAVDIGGIYVKNYQKLYEILQSNNIKLIAVGYPMRSIQPLELIFNSSEVLVINNKINFKTLVEKEGYDQFFVDRFAGDFGHCSEEGNLLLAENIASVIVENWEKISGEN